MVHSKFFHYFPIPSFLHMPAAGVDISDDAIRFVVFSSGNGTLAVAASGEKPIREGAVVAGKIVDVEEVSRALSEIKREHRIEFARVTVPDERVYLFTTALPTLSESEVRSALEFKLEEHVPISIAEAVFDYKVEQRRDDDTIEVIVGAMAESEAAVYVDAIRKAGMTPLSLEVESQATVSAVMPKGEKDLALVVNFETSKTGIYLVNRGLVHFSITLPIEPDVPVLAHVPQGVEDAAVSAEHEKFHDPAFKRLPLVKDEIDKMVNYWKDRGGHSSESVIDTVIVTGADASNAKLIDYFTGLVSMKVSVADVWSNVRFEGGYTPDLPHDESLKYGAAVGAAIIGLPL